MATVSELAVVAIACAVCIPVSVAIVGLICRAILVRTFEHMEKTDTVGGQPREIFVQKAEQEIKQKMLKAEARKPKPIPNRGLIT